VDQIISHDLEGLDRLRGILMDLEVHWEYQVI